MLGTNIFASILEKSLKQSFGVDDHALSNDAFVLRNWSALILGHALI